MAYNPKSVGKALKLLRLKHDLTQADLADIAGVNVTTISNWETGLNPPSIEKVWAIADALNIDDINDVVGRTSKTSVA